MRWFSTVEEYAEDLKDVANFLEELSENVDFKIGFMECTSNGRGTSTIVHLTRGLPSIAKFLNLEMEYYQEDYDDTKMYYVKLPSDDIIFEEIECEVNAETATRLYVL